MGAVDPEPPLAGSKGARPPVGERGYPRRGEAAQQRAGARAAGAMHRNALLIARLPTVSRSTFPVVPGVTTRTSTIALRLSLRLNATATLTDPRLRANARVLNGQPPPWQRTVTLDPAGASETCRRVSLAESAVAFA